MTLSFFQSLEQQPQGTRFPAADIINNLSFKLSHNGQDLIAVITQDTHSKQVLMMAWMNRQALEYSLQTGLMTYWSRSRNCLWKKGESSGHWQKIVSLQTDCDGDALLFQVEQIGSACHTGREHCFYFSYDARNNEFFITSDPVN